MKVKFLTGVAFHDGPAYAPGEVGDIDELDAKRYIAAGLAEGVEPEKARRIVKRETRKK